MKVSEGTRYVLYNLVSVTQLPSDKRLNNEIKIIRNMIHFNKCLLFGLETPEKLCFTFLQALL